jgi:hypothetical protein
MSSNDTEKVEVQGVGLVVVAEAVEARVAGLSDTTTGDPLSPPMDRISAR